MGIATQVVDLWAVVGRRVLNFLYTAGQLSLFSLRSFALIMVPPYRLHHHAEQILKIGVRSLPIASLVALFVGMVMMLQTGYQLMRFGAKLYSAGITAVALAREMIPIFTAVVVGARVAASNRARSSRGRWTTTSCEAKRSPSGKRRSLGSFVWQVTQADVSSWSRKAASRVRPIS